MTIPQSGRTKKGLKKTAQSKKGKRGRVSFTNSHLVLVAFIIFSITIGYFLTHGSHAGSPENDCSRSAIDVPSCGVLWGAYVPSYGLPTLESQVGRKFDIFQEYHDFSSTSSGQIPNSSDQTLINGGRILLASWQNRIYSSGAVDSWADIAAGDYDSTVIIPQADRIKALGSTKIFLSFAPEMNDTSSHPVASYGTASDYVAAYQHIHDVFAAQGVTNVIWVWTPTGSSSSLSTEAPFYPGDSYVDWIGYDPYNFYECFGDTTWKSAYTTFSRFYNWVEGGGLDPGAESKPLIMDEYGSHDDADDPVASDTNWYAQIPSALNQLPNLKALSEFDAAGSTPSGSCPSNLVTAADISGFTSAGLSSVVLGASSQTPTPSPTPTPTPRTTPTPVPSTPPPSSVAKASPQPTGSSSPTATSPPIPIQTLITNSPTPTISGNIAVPSGDKVTVDGKSVSGSTINTSQLTNGKHTITITQNGHTTTKTIVVQNKLSPLQDLRNEVLAATSGSEAAALVLLGSLIAAIVASVFLVRRLLNLRRVKPGK